MNPLLVVLPYCTKDQPQALKLLKWIQELDPKLDHSLLLVSDDAVPMDDKKALDAFGKTIFRYSETIMLKCPAPINGNYHVPSAFMFLKSMGHIITCFKHNWLWLEPDCVPLKSGWLDMLADEYHRIPRKYMGSIHEFKQEGVPPRVMFATAVYPNNAFDDLKSFCDGKEKAFDMAFSPHLAPSSTNTTLIQHVFGAPSDPPRFKDVKDPADGPNVGTLSSIKPDAVLFHRNKDGSLIDLLRKQPQVKGYDPSLPFQDLPPKYDPAIIKDFAPNIPPPDLANIKRGPGRPRVVHAEPGLTQSVT